MFASRHRLKESEDLLLKNTMQTPSRSGPNASFKLRQKAMTDGIGTIKSKQAEDVLDEELSEHDVDESDGLGTTTLPKNLVIQSLNGGTINLIS